MKLLPTNCPNCNSLQSFSPRRRENEGSVIFYIVCKMCRWETDIERMDSKDVRATRKTTGPFVRQVR